jgi:hypothetical protein
MSTYLFQEKQSFRSSIKSILLLGLFTFFIYGFYRQYYLHLPFGDHPMSNLGYFIFLICFIVFLIFFLSITLETKINEEGISVRFFPIQLNSKFFFWNEIEKVEVVRYNPILEYGGWGYRGLNYSRKRAINISGNKGIKIYFKDGKLLLIGTQKKEEVEKILTKIEKINTKFSN